MYASKHIDHMFQIALSAGLPEDEAMNIATKISDPAIKKELAERTQQLSENGGNYMILGVDHQRQIQEFVKGA